MGQRTCSACAGTGRSVTVTHTGGLARGDTCPTCWGTGMIHVPDPKPSGGGKDSKTKSGCFIATAVFGDYDAPEVIVLRAFRDESLSETRLGRSFIQAYYAVSPSIAAVIEKSELLRRVVLRIFLQPTIRLIRYFKS